MPQARARTLMLGLCGLTLLLILLGAYVRLSDAGLGCPDWPGCYGQLSVPNSNAALAQASQQFNATVDPERAHKEMLHRYVAGSYGLLLLAGMAWLHRQPALRRMPRLLLWSPALLIILQAALGRWTVTLKLMPIVVTSHLLGGLSLLALLSAITARTLAVGAPLSRHSARLGWLALLATLTQIALGGWVASNYAALACGDFPACQGSLLPPPGLAEAMHPFRQLGLSADNAPLNSQHLVAIHWLHRCGALLLSGLIVAYSSLLWRQRRRQAASLLLAALALQLALGIGNIAWRLPLPLAVAHTGGAALLLALLSAILAHPRLPANPRNSK